MADFEVLDLGSTEIRGTRMSIEGMPESGKSAFVATAPTPNVWFTFDMGYLRALKGKRREWFKGLKIKVVSYLDDKGNPRNSLGHADWVDFDIVIVKLPHPVQDGSDDIRGQRELWNFFIDSCAAVVDDLDYVRTCSIDTMTLAREVKTDAQIQNYQEAFYRKERNDKRVNLLQQEYRVPNDAIRDIYMNFEGVERINLIATHHLTDERQDTLVTDRNGNQRTERMLTGNKLLKGLATTYQFVDTALRFEMVRSETDTSGPGNTRRAQVDVVAEFKKCGYCPELTGSTMRNPYWNSVHNLIELREEKAIAFPRSKIVPPRAEAASE